MPTRAASGAVRRILVSGEWRETGEVLPVVSPWSGDVVAEVARARPEDLEDAVAGAARAFGETRRLPAGKRVEMLRAAAAGVRARAEEIARSITLCNGKPIRDARGEVARCVQTLSLSADVAGSVTGEVVPLDLDPRGEGRLGISVRVPVGPVLAISPFNFPLNLSAHKAAPALAVGNTVVLKPAATTPLPGLLLAECLLAAGVPPAALSVLACDRRDADRLVADDRFRLLTFTGSPAVGWDLKARAGRKPVVLELGGNAAAIVHEDADLDSAVDRCVHASFAYAGQVCISVQRILVHRPVADRFRAAFLDRTAKLRVGDPLDEGTDVGPMITRAAAEKIEGWIRDAVQAGARLLRGGGRNGQTVEPAVLEDVDPRLPISCEEAFAPIVCLATYDRFEDALERANASRFGLQAGVFTRDVGRILHAFRTLDVGAVIVNDAPIFRADVMPYGGTKDSGLGREGPRYALEHMTEWRTLALRT
ncbi:MAG: aldehyde dehydrogenase family protein [Planctomycetales bacterium]|nr:aldehyde dehydrogenase family protein [Planctomycetales bacterium]